MTVALSMVITYIIGFFLILVGISFIFGVQEELMSAPGKIGKALSDTVSGVFGGDRKTEIVDANYDAVMFSKLVDECWVKGKEAGEDQQCYVLIGRFEFTIDELKETLGAAMFSRLEIRSDFKVDRLAMSYIEEDGKVVITG